MNTRAVISLGLLLTCEIARGDDAVERGRSVLKEAGNIPWYDPETDQLRPLRPRPHVPPDDPLRRSAWESVPSSTTTAPTTTGGGRGGAAGTFSLSPLLQVFGYILLASALTLVTLMLIFKARLRRWFASVDAEEVLPQTSRKVDQINALPIPVNSADGDLLGEARRRYEAGDYGNAVIYLFSYQLLQLDERRIIRLAKGKTNRRYLREAAGVPELRGLLERTMIAFEDVFFGRHRLERERFEACWAGLDEFHRRLAETPA